jgi:hypothetical protein
VEHEASTSKIGEDQLFYFQSRGVEAEAAVGMIISGFCREVSREWGVRGWSCCSLHWGRDVEHLWRHSGRETRRRYAVVWMGRQECRE